MIEVVAVTTVDFPAHLRAVVRTLDALPKEYGTGVMIVDAPSVPATIDLVAQAGRPDLPITVRAFPPNHGGHSRLSWNRFIKDGLAEVCPRTDFVLTVHTDGFALNPPLWTDDFLKHDYIGAPWAVSPSFPGRRVGNGGFSLRSRKWLDAQAKVRWSGNVHEDLVLCVFEYEQMAAMGCRTAPLELALRFSYETKLPDFPDWSIRRSFGFHGQFNLPEVQALYGL